MVLMVLMVLIPSCNDGAVEEEGDPVFDLAAKVAEASHGLVFKDIPAGSVSAVSPPCAALCWASARPKVSSPPNASYT